MFVHRLAIGVEVMAMLLAAGTSSAQSSNPAADKNTAKPATNAVPPVNVAPVDYLIGPDDVLFVSFWRDKDLSTDAVVRPDGKISLPLLNDVQAAGFTPAQLRDALAKRLTEYMPNAEVSVIVLETKSTKVSVIGEVSKPARYELASRTTVLDAIANATVNHYIASAGSPRVDFFFIPWYLWSGAILFAIGVSLMAAAYPAYRAARVDPIKALRHD